MTAQQGPGFLRRAEAARRQIREVGVAEVRSLLQSGAELLDLRDVEAFAAGHLRGARRVSGSALPLQAAGILPDRRRAVVLVSGRGHRSAIAALELQTLGYQRVASLRGGLAAWPEPLPQS